MNTQIDTLLTQAVQSFNRGDLPNAERLLKRALLTAPKNPDALKLLGIMSFQRGNVQESLRLLQEVVTASPGDPMGYYNLAKVHMHVGDYARALELLDSAVRLSPDDYWTRINRGVSLSKLKRFEQALESFDQAIALDPAQVTGWWNLALCLEDGGKYAQALQAYDQAIQRKPGFPDAWSGKGSLLRKLKRFDEALAHLDKAIQCNPAFAQAWSNKGVTLAELQRHAEALSCYDRAIQVEPDYADSYCNKSLTQLALGDFEHGWANYHRYRWKAANADPYLHPELPELEAVEEARGKNVLVWAEQGLGDTLQFSRYVSLLANVGALVIFEVQPELCPLFENQFPCRIIPKGARYGSADLQVPLLQLPFLFDTREDNIPAGVPYLRAAPQNIARWERVLDRNARRLNVGIACSGNPAYQNDQVRSIPLELFQPLLEAANCYVLQKEVRESDRAYLQAHPEMHFLGEDLENTAAIMSNLDLTISVDTSLVHLAGALGKPVFVLLPWAPDWRWMLERKDSPWYPTARLFRQATYRDWTSVIEEVTEELKRFEARLSRSAT